MPAKYWIKLYHEILHDRKMATLDNRTWRRVIECFLFAGEVDADGYLPKVADMAWILHITDEELETDLNELVRLGILEHREGLYFVRKFHDRQKPMDKAEYMRRKREEQRLQTYYQPSYQPVTNSHTDKNRIDKNRVEEIPAQDAVTAATAIPLSAEGIFNKVTGFATFPGNQRQYINTIEAMRETWGADNIIEVLKRHYKTWCNTPRKDGNGNYNPLNLGWIDQAQKELAKPPVSFEGVNFTELNKEQRDEYIRQKYPELEES